MTIGRDALVVAIETSAREGSLAAQRGGEQRFTALAGERAHASDLVPALDRLVRELGAKPSDLAIVLVGTGPGSYTGLRVGIATALGLARASGARARGVPSGETQAFWALDPGQEAIVLQDGRSGGFYVAHYRRTEREIEIVTPPTVLTRADLERALPSGVPILCQQTDATAAGLDENVRARVRTGTRADARALLALGLERLEQIGDEPLDRITPLYLRPFVATQRKI